MTPLMIGALVGQRPWTPTEDDALRSAYRSGGIYAAHAALPARSVPSLYHRARRLKLDRRRRWTRRDVLCLRDLWGEATPIGVIAKALKRTPATVYWHAQQLGLTAGPPDGWEYLSTAAERCGYEAGQLRRILRWAGVKLRVVLGRPGVKPRGRKPKRIPRHFHVVETFAVDVALETWHTTEPVETAARRLGLCGETLARRCARLGIVRAGKKQHLRVTAEQVRAALAPIPKGYRRVHEVAARVG